MQFGGAETVVEHAGGVTDQNGDLVQRRGYGKVRGEAEHAARRLPSTANSVGNAQFSETTVAVYRIGVHSALGDSAKALSFSPLWSPVACRLPNAAPAPTLTGPERGETTATSIGPATR